MEVTGFVILSTSSDGSDAGDAAKLSLHTFNHVKKEPLVYGRGDREACKKFIKSGTEESNAVGLPGRKNARFPLLIKGSLKSAFTRLSA